MPVRPRRVQQPTRKWNEGVGFQTCRLIIQEGYINHAHCPLLVTTSCNGCILTNSTQKMIELPVLSFIKYKRK